MYFCLSDPVNGEYEYYLVTLFILLETHFNFNCESNSNRYCLVYLMVGSGRQKESRNNYCVHDNRYKCVQCAYLVK